MGAASGPTWIFRRTRLRSGQQRFSFGGRSNSMAATCQIVRLKGAKLSGEL